MENVKRIYLRGVQFENKHQFIEAYKCYLTCMNEVTKNLSIYSFQPNQQGLCTNLMKVSSKCLKNIEYLFPKLQQLPQQQHIPHRQPSPFFQTNDNQKMIFHQRKNNNPIPVPIPTQKMKKISTSEDARSEWVRLKREMENRGIQKMTSIHIESRQQLQLYKTQQESEKEAAKYRRSIKNRLYQRVNWRRNDQWTRFIQNNLHYTGMNNSMLLKDQKFIETIGKSPTSHIFETNYNTTNNSPSPYRNVGLPIDPKERQDMIKEEIRVFIEEYVFHEPQIHQPSREELSRSLRFGTEICSEVPPKEEKHKVMVLVERFVSSIRDEYFLPRKDSLSTLNVRGLQDDILSFVQNTVGYLLGRLWTINDDESISTILERQIVNSMYVVIFKYIQRLYLRIDCRLIITEKVTKHSSPRIQNEVEVSNFEHRLREFNKLRDVFEKNISYNNILMKIGGSITLKQLGLKQKFRLELLQQPPFEEIILLFRQFVSKGWVVEKLQITERCLQMVTECVCKYYKTFHPNKQPPPVGAEELLPIFVYCLLKSGNKDMFYIFHYIETFLTEDLLRGSMGYSLATLETSLSYIATRLSIEELSENEKKLNEKEGRATIKEGGAIIKEGGTNLTTLPPQQIIRPLSYRGSSYNNNNVVGNRSDEEGGIVKRSSSLGSPSTPFETPVNFEEIKFEKEEIADDKDINIIDDLLDGL